MKNLVLALGVLFTFTAMAEESTYTCRAKWAVEKNNPAFSTIPAIQFSLSGAQTLTKYADGYLYKKKNVFVATASEATQINANSAFQPKKYVNYNQFVMNSSIEAQTPKWSILIPKNPTQEQFSVFIFATDGEAGGDTEYLCN